jgi:glycosyltransferase involved in cell wall biosynthesis
VTTLTVPPLRALTISYAFPPVGGAGVQRVAKLVKYLPDFDVTPAVLTVANPSAPLTDGSFAKDLPNGVEVVRARTFEPGYKMKGAVWQANANANANASATNGAAAPTKAAPTGIAALRKQAIKALASTAKAVLIPDPQIMWLPGAQLALAKRLLSRQDDVVLISGPPFSQFLVAPLIRARRQVGIVLDYRDEWRTYRSSYEMFGGSAAKIAGDVLEPMMLRCAHRVTCATEEFREQLLKHHSFLDPQKVITITNGYDSEDFDVELPDPPSDRFVITYAGTIFKLTSPRGFIPALRLLHERSPDLAKLVNVRFLGRIVETERDLFVDAERLGITLHDYVPHDQVLPFLSASHLTLCLLDAVEGTERIFPAKIFELMHLGRPILTLAPEGALHRLATRHRVGDVLPPRDEVKIAEALERRIRAFKDDPKKAGQRVIPPGTQCYDRRALAGEFAGVLHDAYTETGAAAAFANP